jgi:hypothetical protein
MRAAAEEVTTERIERALTLLAYLVVLDGPVLAPLFERLERELATVRAGEDVVGRARRRLEAYTTAGGVRAIR